MKILHRKESYGNDKISSIAGWTDGQTDWWMGKVKSVYTINFFGGGYNSNNDNNEMGEVPHNSVILHAFRIYIVQQLHDYTCPHLPWALFVCCLPFIISWLLVIWSLNSFGISFQWIKPMPEILKNLNLNLSPNLTRSKSIETISISENYFPDYLTFVTIPFAF